MLRKSHCGSKESLKTGLGGRCRASHCAMQVGAEGGLLKVEILPVIPESCF